MTSPARAARQNDARARKGAAIHKAGGVHFDAELGAYFVASGSGTMHDVTADRTKCSCMDFRYRREPCKHIHAAMCHAEAASQ